MKKVFQLSLALIGISFFSLTSCSKDDDPPKAPAFEETSFDHEAILAKVPEGLKNSDDTYAQSCYGYIQQALSWNAFSSVLTPPEGAEQVSSKSTDDGRVTYRWSAVYGDWTYTYYWTYEKTSTQHVWTIEFQFNDGPAYPYLTLTELLDGTGGTAEYNFNWLCYFADEDSESCEDLRYFYTWEAESDGTYRLNWSWESGTSDVTYFLSYEIVLNADGSGNLEYYSEDELLYSMEWDAVGNGSWVFYLDGETYMSGSWSV